MEKKNNELTTEEINAISEELSEEQPMFEIKKDFTIKEGETFKDALKRYISENIG